jgi:hypothetical protein
MVQIAVSTIKGTFTIEAECGIKVSEVSDILAVKTFIPPCEQSLFDGWKRLAPNTVINSSTRMRLVRITSSVKNKVYLFQPLSHFNNIQTDHVNIDQTHLDKLSMMGKTGLLHLIK